MVKIELVKELIESEFLSPLKKFKKDITVTERRKNPLTGEWCRISIERATRPKEMKDHLESKLIKESGKKCFFCKAKIHNSVARFPSWLVTDGKIKINEFFLFPNLYPFAKYHAVGVLTEKHFVGLDKIKPEKWEDCFEGCMRFFKLVHEEHPSARFPSINFNFFPTAGASLLHPHTQVLNTIHPTVMMDLYYRKSWDYFDKNKSNYWQDLIEQEDGGERFIGKTGSMYWFANFAPIHTGEIIGILKGNVSSFFEMNEEDVKDVCEGIYRIFNCIYGPGKGYNMVIYSAPLNEHLGHFFSLNLSIITRPKMSEYYTTDRAYCEILHKEPIITTIPEDLASKLRKKF